MPNWLIDWVWRMKWYIGAILFSMGAALVVFFLGVFSGNHDTYERMSLIAYAISYGGTCLTILGTVLWIVFIDSKRRWPNVPAFDRFARVVTFYRD